MDEVTLYNAKARLSEFVQRASEGERFVITRHGRPVAMLVPIEAAARPAPGAWAGEVRYALDYDAADDELAAMLTGDPDGAAAIAADVNAGGGSERRSRK